MGRLLWKQYKQNKVVGRNYVYGKQRKTFMIGTRVKGTNKQRKRKKYLSIEIKIRTTWRTLVNLLNKFRTVSYYSSIVLTKICPAYYDQSVLKILVVIHLPTYKQTLINVFYKSRRNGCQKQKEVCFGLTCFDFLGYFEKHPL